MLPNHLVPPIRLPAYQGPKGGFRFGIQYSYFEKNGWSGNGNVAGAAGFAPKAVDNMIWTSVRYYLP